MKKSTRLIFGMCSFLITALFLPISAFAENLPPGFLIGDSEGIHVDGTGQYYVHEEDVMPGDEFVKTITLMNTEEGDRPYDLTMDVAPREREGEINFYESIQVVMSLDGEVVYEGNLIGEGTPDIQNNRLELGSYAYGDKKELTVVFNVSDELPAEVWQSESYAIIQWNFYAVKGTLPTTGEPEPPKVPVIGKLPQTGEEWRNALFRIIAGLFVVSVVLVIVKRRKDSEKQNTP